RPRSARVRGSARRPRPLGAAVPGADVGARQVRAALHAPRARHGSGLPGPELRAPRPVRRAVLPHHPGWAAHAVPLPAGSGRGSPARKLRRDLAGSADAAPAPRVLAGWFVWRVLVPVVVRWL